MRLEYVGALGTFAAYREPPGSADEYGACPPDLEAGFQEAMRAGLEIAGGLLPLEWRQRETILLLAAVVAFKGLLGLSRAIESGGVWCSSCEQVVDTPMYAVEGLDDSD
jgi:hypothetical protein